MAEKEAQTEASSTHSSKGIRWSLRRRTTGSAHRTWTVVARGETHSEPAAPSAHSRVIRNAHKTQTVVERDEDYDPTDPSSIPENLKEFYPTGKLSWPELVGLSGEEAEKKIKEEKAGVRTHVLPVGCLITLDYWTNRVRIFVDSSGNVAEPPKIG